MLSNKNASRVNKSYYGTSHIHSYTLTFMSMYVPTIFFFAFLSFSCYPDFYLLYSFHLFSYNQVYSRIPYKARSTFFIIEEKNLKREKKLFSHVPAQIIIDHTLFFIISIRSIRMCIFFFDIIFFHSISFNPA